MIEPSDLCVTFILILPLKDEIENNLAKLADPDDAQRRSAIEWLGETLLKDLSGKDQRRIIEALANVFEEKRNPLVKPAIAYMLMPQPKVSRSKLRRVAVGRSLDDDEPREVRLAALDLLVAIGLQVEYALNAVRNLLHDEDKEIAAEAKKVLKAEAERKKGTRPRTTRRRSR